MLTRATLVIEAAIPLLVFSPFRTNLTRTIAIAGGVALHLGIFLTMRVGIFSQVMPLSYLAFVPIRWIDAGEAAVARVAARWRAVARPSRDRVGGRPRTCRAPGTGRSPSSSPRSSR